MKFSEQAPVFLEKLAERKRRPVKPATMRAYKGYINNWILPNIGDQDLATFNNGAMKRFAEKLVGLGPKSLQEVTAVVKLIMASVLTEDGDQVYPRTWNNDFIDLPVVTEQRQPTVTGDQITSILPTKWGVLYALLAGTGLRIGEALALRFGRKEGHTAWEPDRSLISVHTSLYYGKEQSPKTHNGVRVVELEPNLNRLLCSYIKPPAIASDGQFVFSNRLGRPMGESTIREHGLAPLGIHGFHAFRRFRVTHLRRMRVPEEIIRFWIGHGQGGVTTDRYSKLAGDEDYRKECAAKIGLGFEIPQRLA